MQTAKIKKLKDEIVIREVKNKAEKEMTNPHANAIEVTCETSAGTEVQNIRVKTNVPETCLRNQNLQSASPFHYFDYKTLEDVKDKKETEQNPTHARRLSKDDSALLTQILSGDERELPHFGIKRSELDKLFKSLGGKMINKKGSKFRYELNDLWGDMPSSVASLPQHSNHGQDNRNDFVSKYTVMQFRSLLQRAGVQPDLGLLNTHSP